MHYCGACRDWRIRLAFSDQLSWIANRKQSHRDRRPGDPRREAARCHDCAEEWFFLRAGCEDRKAYLGQAFSQTGMGQLDRSQYGARGRSPGIRRRWKTVDCTQLVADEL